MEPADNETQETDGSTGVTVSATSVCWSWTLRLADWPPVTSDAEYSLPHTTELGSFVYWLLPCVSRSCEPTSSPNKGSSKNPETGRHKWSCSKMFDKLTHLRSHGKGRARETGNISMLNGFLNLQLLILHGKLVKVQSVAVAPCEGKVRWSRVQGHPDLHRDLILKKIKPQTNKKSNKMKQISGPVCWHLQIQQVWVEPRICTFTISQVTQRLNTEACPHVKMKWGKQNFPSIIPSVNPSPRLRTITFCVFVTPLPPPHTVCPPLGLPLNTQPSARVQKKFNT